MSKSKRVLIFSFTEAIDLPATPASEIEPPTPAGQSGEKYYVEQIYDMKQYDYTVLYVDFSHLLEREEVLARAIQDQYYR